MSSLSTTEFEDVLDSYFYNMYFLYREDATSSNNAFLTSPYPYFRNKFLYKNYTREAREGADILNYIKSTDERYLFLFNTDGTIKNPEFLEKSDLDRIDSILQEDNDNFYALNAQLIRSYNKCDLDLDLSFSKILEIEQDNPHILARLSRYQASALYKKFKDRKYLLLGKESLLKAIEQFKDLKEIPSFFYSWLGYIEHELGNYHEAIRLYDDVVDINKKLGMEVPEPYVWKSFSLNKLGEYKESLDLCLWFLHNDELNEFNDKRDFRFYKVISDNYFNVGDYELFYEYLVETIKKYLDTSSFHFSKNLLLDANNTKFEFVGFLGNSYDSFLSYTKSYIKTDFDYIIFSIAYIYILDLGGGKFEFNDSRGIEKLCYNYLQYIYEGKGK